jgi:hypothetical protein
MMISENIFLKLSQKVQNLGFKQSLIEISKIAFDGIPIDRLTVWTLENNNTILKCDFKMQTNVTTFECSDTLDLAKYPAYHKALLSEKVISANDVYNSTFVFELDDDYLKPNNICSSASFPFFVDGKLSGMVVISTVERYYNWRVEDIQFGNDVAQVISIAYVSSKRNEDLNKLNKYAAKIKTMNEELKLVIEKKNEQFIEYGFINSHLLNAPLSRLKGLMNLIVIEMDGENRETELDFLISKVYEEYKAMDDIVTQISVLVNKGEELDRDDIVTD